MTSAQPAVGDVGRHAAQPRRGLAAAVAVAVIGIGAGTWFLGSGPDSSGPAQDGTSSLVSGAVVGEKPGEGQAEPALSVAPAPSEAAYAAARRASRSATKAPVHVSKKPATG